MKRGRTIYLVHLVELALHSLNHVAHQLSIHFDFIFIALFLSESRLHDNRVKEGSEALMAQIKVYIFDDVLNHLETLLTHSLSERPLNMVVDQVLCPVGCRVFSEHFLKPVKLIDLCILDKGLTCCHEPLEAFGVFLLKLFRQHHQVCCACIFPESVLCHRQVFQ